MKVKKLENVHNKMGLKGCKWSSLNAPGTGTEFRVSHQLLGNREPTFQLFSNGVWRRVAPVGYRYAFRRRKTYRFPSLQYKEMVYYGRLC